MNMSKKNERFKEFMLSCKTLKTEDIIKKDDASEASLLLYFKLMEHLKVCIKCRNFVLSHADEV